MQKEKGSCDNYKLCIELLGTLNKFKFYPLKRITLTLYKAIKWNYDSNHNIYWRNYFHYYFKSCDARLEVLSFRQSLLLEGAALLEVVNSLLRIERISIKERALWSPILNLLPVLGNLTATNFTVVSCIDSYTPPPTPIDLRTPSG